MSSVHQITPEETVLLRSGKQFSELFIAGTENPPVIMAASISAVTGTDMIGQISFHTVTAGAYTNILPDMTCWIGTGPGLQNVGTARVRKAATSSILYIGETSEINWAVATHLTVVDEIDLHPRHVRIVNKVPFMDYDIAYSNQHEVFAPIVLMGSDVVKDVAAYPVTVQFPDASDSYVFGSTISAWSWASNAGTWTDETTDDPTLTISSYPANGRIRVSLTLTSAAGGTYTGYRYIYVYDSAHPPVKISTTSGMRQTRESGCWTCSVTMHANATQANIRDHTPIIIFARDYYGGTKVSLGNIPGRENICMIGWIVGASIIWNPDGSSVEFSVEGAPSLLDKMMGYPPGVEMATSTPTAWTSMPLLNVARSLWHLLHHRSTATRRMDVRITGDARLATKFATPSSTIWSQIKEIGGKSILVSPGCDRYGRLFIDVHPQLTPESDRTWNTCMVLEKRDWHGRIAIRDRALSQTAQVVLSGVAVDATKSYSTFFSLSNGHVPKRFGSIDVRDKLLLSSQAQSNELAGLIMALANLPFDIEIELAQNNRFLEVFPNNTIAISIDDTDTIRGKSYIGNIVPSEIELAWDSKNHSLTTSMRAEPETQAEIAINGDVPGIEIDLSQPPRRYSVPSLPMPIFTYPPIDVQTNTHPTDVVLQSSTHGVFYTQTFDQVDADIIWYSMNAGLSELARTEVANLVVTPSGSLYLLGDGDNVFGWNSLYVADSLGGIWREILTTTDFDTALGKTGCRLWGLGVNPLANDEVAVYGGRLWSWPYDGEFGSGSLAIGGKDTSFSFSVGNSYFRQGKTQPVFTNNGWTVYLNQGTGILGSLITHYVFRFDSGGTIITAAVSNPTPNAGSANHAAAGGTLDRSWFWGNGVLRVATDDAATFEALTILPEGVCGVAPSPSGMFLMSSDAGTVVKSSDYGATWVLPPTTIGPVVFENCRDNYRWIFGGGANIRFTPDFGETFVNKIGNLLYNAPLIDVTILRYVK